MRKCCSIIIIVLLTSSLVKATPPSLTRLLSTQGEALCNPCLFKVKGEVGGQLRMRTKQTDQGDFIYQVDFFPSKAKAFRIHRESLHQDAIPVSEIQAFSVDLNQDGYQDIALLVSQGSQGQKYFRYWIFDPRTKSHKALKSEKALEFAELRHTNKKDYLVSEIRNQGLNTEQLYKIRGHRLKLVKSQTKDHRIPSSLLEKTSDKKKTN